YGGKSPYAPCDLFLDPHQIGLEPGWCIAGIGQREGQHFLGQDNPNGGAQVFTTRPNGLPHIGSDGGQFGAKWRIGNCHGVFAVEGGYPPAWCQG
ncbi:MAG: hypothetical protein RL076_2401, partial [Chloroflexota bacterium]